MARVWLCRRAAGRGSSRTCTGPGFAVTGTRQGALGVCETSAARAACGRQARMGPQSDRPVRAGAPGKRKAFAVGGGEQGDAAASRHAGSDRPAADAGRSRCVHGRPLERRVRARRRSTARVAALRRTLGAPLAGPRALCRHQRPRKGQPPRHLEVPRLGDRRAESRYAVRSRSRSSRSPATCCRMPPYSRRSPAGSTATR